MNKAEFAAVKTMAAMAMEEELLRFRDLHGRFPRIAVLGIPPFVETFGPTRDLLHGSGIPFGVFTDRLSAEDWLLKEESE